MEQNARETVAVPAFQHMRDRNMIQTYRAYGKALYEKVNTVDRVPLDQCIAISKVRLSSIT